MIITKLDAKTGNIVWTKNVASPNSQTSASAETVAFTSDGGFVVGGGVNSYIPANEMHFKSGGQVEESTAWLGKVSAQDAAGSSEPADFEWEWTTNDGKQGNVKGIRVDHNGDIVAIAGTGALSTLYKVNEGGS